MATEQKKRPGKPAEAIVKNWNVVETKVDGDLKSICIDIPLGAGLSTEPICQAPYSLSYDRHTQHIDAHHFSGCLTGRLSQSCAILHWSISNIQGKTFNIQVHPRLFGTR